MVVFVLIFSGYYALRESFWKFWCFMGFYEIICCGFMIFRGFVRNLMKLLSAHFSLYRQLKRFLEAEKSILTFPHCPKLETPEMWAISMFNRSLNLQIQNSQWSGPSKLTEPFLNRLSNSLQRVHRHHIVFILLKHNYSSGHTT